MTQVKTAVILFNLGGPDSLDSVRPFLRNLFSDKAIIGAPFPIRWWLARKISAKRAPVAREIYAKLGGASPLLAQTEAQARALETALGEGFRCFIAMRYWHPFAREAASQAKAWGAQRVVLLPLYPQFSTTTTGSSLKDWDKAARLAGLKVPQDTICCYPDDPGLVTAMATLTQEGMVKASAFGKPRVLFSAHGLPKQVIERGDPYQAQVERTAAQIIRAMGHSEPDWSICYQSRVGPLVWIGPSTEEELERAAKDKVPVVVVPIAFVSEHSETLVELDMEYREQAARLGVPGYVRVPALGCHPRFVEGLAKLVNAPSVGKACTAMGRRCPC